MAKNVKLVIFHSTDNLSCRVNFLENVPKIFAMCVRWTVRNSKIENCAIFGQNVLKIHQHQQYKELFYAQLQGFIFRKDTWFSVKPILGLSQLCAQHMISIFSREFSKYLLLFSEMVFLYYSTQISTFLRTTAYLVGRRYSIKMKKFSLLWRTECSPEKCNFPFFLT